MKKVLSLVLVIAMVLSSFSFAFAAKFEDVEGDYEEAVGVLSALGVITGYEDGTYRPERIVTRAEMAKLIVEILGYGDLVAGSASNFADTQGHWADPWIALAAGRGLVIGTGDGNFTPDRQVSYDEAITMIVRALGYTDNSNELKGMTWPTNFKVKASELKLLDGVKLLAGGADRGGIAQLLFNALDASLVTVDTDGNIVYQKDEDKKDMPLLSRLADKKSLQVNADHVDPDHKNYKGDVVDLYQYMYQNITVYEKDDVVVFVKSVNSLVLTGTVTKVTDTSITVEDANEDKYTFDTADEDYENFVDDFMYNMGESNYAKYFGKLFEDEVGAEVTLVLEGEDGDKIKNGLDVWAIVATKASGYVQVEDVYEKDELTLDAIYLPKDGKVVDFDNLVIKGDADSLEDIEEDDVLGVFVPLNSDGNDDYFETKAADKMTIIVARETVEGRITRKSGSDYTIGGKVYGSNPFSNPDLSAGDEGLFYLDHEGNIFAFEEEDSSTPANYALVIEAIDGFQTPSGTVLADPKVKVLTAAGEEVTYVIDKKTDIKDIDGNVLGKVVWEDDQELVVELYKWDVVKYSLNSSKAINKLTYIDMGYDDDALDLKTTVNAFNLAKNAAIFNVPGDVEDAEVIGADDLDKEIVAYRFRNTKGEIEVLVVIEGGAEEAGIFALITKGDGDEIWVWDEDEETDVIEYTAYVDGKKVFYLKHKDFDFDGDDYIDANPYIYELKLSSGKLKVVDYVEEEPVYGLAENSRVTNSIKDDNTGEVFFLADDVVVYVLKDNGSFDKVGTKSDIRGKYFMLYDTVDADQDYDIVVVWQNDDFMK